MKINKAAIHAHSGKYIQIENTKAFVYEKGNGEPVVCFHGVPASSFLYRNVIDQLATKGFRGISFDLLGLGLSDRPTDFTYTWTNLGEWSAKVIDQLGIDEFHIVIHDIGGPIGAEVISRIPNRVLSVTILNTLLTNLDHFKKPFPMFLYEKKGIGELVNRLTTPFFFKKLMQARGVNKKESFGIEEARAYIHFLNGSDQGQSFLNIMRSFEATSQKEQLYIQSLRRLNVPMQIIWGTNDKGLTLEKYGTPLKKALGIKRLFMTPGAHFLQEDYAEEITEYISDLIKK